MKIAFWNINLGTGSDSNKNSAFTTWCTDMKPDLLILEEGSFTLTAKDYVALNALSGMTTLGHVATLDKNSNESTKQLVALTQPGNPQGFQTRDIRLPGLTAIRMVIKVTRSKLEVYGIHANASQSGGLAATEAASVLLKGNDIGLVGGDFNYGIGKVTAGSPVKPMRFDGKALTCTQWNTQKGNLDAKQQAADFGFTGSTHVDHIVAPNTQGVIDYVMHGASLKVTAVPNCASEANWRNIVAFFDHGPVVYTVA
jgi:hypothetical protein